MSRFVANLYRNQLALNKMYPLKTYEVDQELGGEECPLLHAGGWEIDHQEKHCKSPGECIRGEGAWLQVNIESFINAEV